MLVIIILFVIICVATTIAVLRSKRPMKEIFAEAKYEFIYNVIGSKAIIEDIMSKGINKAGKKLFFVIIINFTSRIEYLPYFSKES